MLFSESDCFFQHFFGGAMGVFTTQTLLNSVGISRNRAAQGAVAINWILKVRMIVGQSLYQFLMTKFVICYLISRIIFENHWKLISTAC